MPHPHLMVENSPAGYRWLRLAHSERRNALGVSLAQAMRDALAAEPEVPVLLGSADPRVFCAGADLTVSDAERAAISDLIYECMFLRIPNFGPRSSPTISWRAEWVPASRRSWPPAD